jgi:hypothetical protein
MMAGWPDGAGKPDGVWLYDRIGQQDCVDQRVHTPHAAARSYTLNKAAGRVAINDQLINDG